MRKSIIILVMLLALHAVSALGQSTAHHRLSNLPHIYIETLTGAEVVSKEEQIYCRLWMVDENDKEEKYDSVLIRCRGNSTLKLEKKPYRIKFQKKQRLLGKDHANAKKWTLMANHADKTLFRNALASYIGELCGQTFTAGARFVDLTLNGKYRGTYQISDQIEVNKGRVNITEQDYPLEPESNYTGGYLVEADGFADYVSGKTGWRTQYQNVPMTIHYPDEDEISNVQYNYIRNFVNSFENRLLNTSLQSEQSYRNYVDTLSLISWYLGSEIVANPDYIWSLYFYKDRDDERIHFGPMWDYDIAFDNDNRLENSGHDPSRELMANISFENNGFKQWINRFWQDDWFKRAVFNHYAELVRDGLQQKLLDRVDSLANLLSESQKLNFERWNIRQRVMREVVLFSTYDEYVDKLRSFITIRVPALLKAFSQRHPDHPNVDDLITVEPDITTDPNYFYTISNVGTQTVFDVNTNGLVVANKANSSYSQQWQIIPLSNGYHHLINRQNNLALTDPTKGETTATTNLGTQLAVTQSDSTDLAQQWYIVRQSANRYNLNNRLSDHTANLTGGKSTNGTAIQSYTNDSRNAESLNRQWAITAIDSIPDKTGIERVTDVPYALAYDPYNHRLHFGSDHLSDLTFTAQVIDAAGHPVLRFAAADGTDVGMLPRGTYIVEWTWQGKRHTVKLAL